MKRSDRRDWIVGGSAAGAAWVLVTAAAAWGAAPMSTAFTYQGQLKRAGSPVNDACDCRFSLRDDPTAGVQVGPRLTFDGLGDNPPPVAIVNGLFTVELDFGAGAFNGEARWLQIEVACPSGAAYTALSPRPPVAASPYALQTRGLVVDAAGNVGIGTTVPQARLHVNDHAAFGLGQADMRVCEVTPSDPEGWSSLINLSGIGIGSDTGNNRQIMTVTDGFVGQPIFTVADSTDAGATWNPRLVVTQGVGVAIGTSTPSAPLDVKNPSTELNANAIVGEITSTVPGEVSAGVRGINRGTGESGIGVYGSHEGNGTGVWGSDVGGVGVRGWARGTTGFNAGVYGESKSLDGYGGYFLGRGYFQRRLGLGVLEPAYRLELPNIGSNVEGRARANRWDTYSSIRWKENVRPIGDALGKLLRLTGVEFDWKTEHGGGHDIGFVAEDVGKVLPDIVSWEDDGQHAQGLAYGRLTALLVEAVKEQRKEMESLRAEKDAEIAELKERLARLDAALARHLKGERP